MTLLENAGRLLREMAEQAEVHDSAADTKLLRFLNRGVRPPVEPELKLELDLDKKSWVLGRRKFIFLGLGALAATQLQLPKLPYVEVPLPWRILSGEPPVQLVWSPASRLWLLSSPEHVVDPAFNYRKAMGLGSDPDFTPEVIDPRSTVVYLNPSVE